MLTPDPGQARVGSNWRGRGAWCYACRKKIGCRRLSADPVGDWHTCARAAHGHGEHWVCGLRRTNAARQCHSRCKHSVSVSVRSGDTDASDSGKSNLHRSTCLANAQVALRFGKASSIHESGKVFVRNTDCRKHRIPAQHHKAGTRGIEHSCHARPHCKSCTGSRSCSYLALRMLSFFAISARSFSMTAETCAELAASFVASPPPSRDFIAAASFACWLDGCSSGSCDFAVAASFSPAALAAAAMVEKSPAHAPWTA